MTDKNIDRLVTGGACLYVVLLMVYLVIVLAKGMVLLAAEQESIHIDDPFPVTVYYDSENEPYLLIETDWAQIGVRELIIFNDTDNQAWQLKEVPMSSSPIEPRRLFSIDDGGQRIFRILIRAEAGTAEIRGISLIYKDVAHE